jgi:hypothetical protein
VPAQLDVQLEPQVPPQTDWPAQLLVHPVPQFRLHSFFDVQLYVTLFGAAGLGVPASSDVAPPSVEPAGPSEQVLPLWHVQAMPEHAQFPEHVSDCKAVSSEPPHPVTLEGATAATKTTTPARVRVKA